MKIFSEMGDNVEFNCGKFYVGGNKNNELSKKPCENVSEEEDLKIFENEDFSENFDE